MVFVWIGNDGTHFGMHEGCKLLSRIAAGVQLGEILLLHWSEPIKEPWSEVFRKLIRLVEVNAVTNDVNGVGGRRTMHNCTSDVFGKPLLGTRMLPQPGEERHRGPGRLFGQLFRFVMHDLER